MTYKIYRYPPQGVLFLAIVIAIEIVYLIGSADPLIKSFLIPSNVHFLNTLTKKKTFL